MGNDIKEIFHILIKKVQRFFTSKEDLRAFFVFLFISTCLWMLQALQKENETTIDIPVVYKNVPKNIVFVEELPKKVSVSISGRGNSLISHKLWERFRPIEINIAQNVEKSRQAIATTSLKSSIQKQIKGDVKITRISPDSILFPYEYQQEKVVAVKLMAQFDPMQQYTICDSILPAPEFVTIYGPGSLLDSIEVCETEELTFKDLKDTTVHKVPLKSIRNVIFSDSIVQCTVNTEPFTEKSVILPISVRHLPSNRQLKLFPATATVTFNVGFSHYDLTDASSFALSVDYNDIDSGESKLTVSTRKTPKEVLNVKIKPAAVDFIIEEKNNQE